MINKADHPQAVKEAFASIDTENVDKLRRFLTGGGDENARNDDGLTLLQYAVSKNRLIAATILLEGKADPNLRSKGTHLYTALHYAAERDNTEMIKLLVKNKADPDARDRYGQTPLHVAAYEGNPKAVYALHAADANLLLVDSDGNTARDVAVRRRSETLDFAWQEYIDIEKYLAVEMDKARKLTTEFRRAQEDRLTTEISRIKKHNPGRYKLGQ